jgi:hypothetical protein
VGVDTGEVDRGAGELVLEAGLREAAVAGSAQAAALDALGDGSLDSGAGFVALLPCVGVLLGVGLAEGFVFLTGPQGQAAADGGGGALLADWAGEAVTAVEADPDDGDA